MTQVPFSISPATQRRIDQVKYAVEPNHARYRTITRYFYAEHQKLRDWLAPREVFDAVRRHLDDDYTLEECERDLATLAEWGNLQAEQDRSKARSLAEFYRPRHVYHVTPFTVGLEGLLARSESDQRSGGTLNATLLERIWADLDRLHTTLHGPLPDPLSAEFLRDGVAGPWQVVLAAVADLRESAAAYHHTLSAALPADLAKIEAFLIYRDLLLAHLRGFVGQLDQTGPRLRALVQRWEAEGTGERLVTLLTEADRLSGVSRLSAAGVPLSIEEVREQVHHPALRGLSDWFAPGGGAEFLLQATRNAILHIVRQNARIATRHEAGVSRRRDLERLARALATLELDGAPDGEAHRLMARALAAVLPRHLRGATGADVMMTDKAGSVWRQTPQEFPLRRIRRGRPTKERTSSVADTSAQQAAMAAAEEERLEQERALWDRLFASRSVAVADLWVEDRVLRRRILDVVRRALVNPSRIAMATDGRAVRVTLPDEEWAYGELAGPDGVLVLPAMVLTIEDGADVRNGTTGIAAPAGTAAR